MRGRSGFNRKIDSDMPIQEGRADFTADPWSLAEAASGYTRDNTMSPMQGALIGAAIANDGKMRVAKARRSTAFMGSAKTTGYAG